MTLEEYAVQYLGDMWVAFNRNSHEFVYTTRAKHFAPRYIKFKSLYKVPPEEKYNKKRKDAEIAAVKECLALGMTRKEILAKVGITQSNFYWRMKAIGPTSWRKATAKQEKKRIEDEKLKIINLYNSGLYLVVIAKKMKMGIDALRYRLNQLVNEGRIERRQNIGSSRKRNNNYVASVSA